MVKTLGDNLSRKAPILHGIHHVAYRCKDAKETVEFYSNLLSLDFQLAIAENHIPSTGQFDPYMHLFLDAGNNNVLAFFELPHHPELSRDKNSPEWVQYFALRVGSIDALESAKSHLETNNVKVSGPTDYGFYNSIRFTDPNGHKIELTADTSTPELRKLCRDAAPEVLRNWSEHKKNLAKRHSK